MRVILINRRRYSTFLTFLVLISAFFASSLVYAGIRINEVMASNGVTIADEDGDFEDWIELSNPGEETVDLSGWGLSDDFDRPFQWTFPEGAAIEPGEYLLVWASGKDWPRNRTGLRREVFTGIPGNSVNDLVGHPRFPDDPTKTHRVSDFFEAPANIMEQYGQRMHGFVIAPLSGAYRFWIASDDNGALYLSASEDPGEAVRIAEVPGWTGPRDWSKYPEQRSAPIHLEEGRRYYISALMKEAFGGDNLAVRWERPDGVIEGPVPAHHFETPPGNFHTNFRISREGDPLLLTRADGKRADEIPPTEIPRDFSFGRSREDPEEWVYFAEPSPGEENNNAQSHLLRESVRFSVTSRLFTDPVELALAGASPNQEIRYTTDNSIPGESSELYEEPLLIEETTLIRARLMNEAGAGGLVTSHHFIRVDPSLAEKRSNLPIIVMDAYGAGNEDLNNHPTPSGTERAPGFFLLYDRDAEGVSDLSKGPHLATRQGLRFRGSSSRHWPKRHYSVEFQDEWDEDAFHGILGMEPDSDWVLYNGYQYDRAGIRNSIAYDLSRAMGRWAPDTRFAEVYVNHDGGTLGSSENDYMGYYAVVERIKQREHRLGPENVNSRDVPPDGPINVDEEGPWTGGYIFKTDRQGDDEYRWRTDNNMPGAEPFVLSRPKLHSLDGGPYSNSASAEGGSRQVRYIREYVQAFEDALFADHDRGFETREYLRYIDKGSFVDHLLINAFTKNVDGLRLSAFFNKPENEPIVAGPVWDFDRSMGSFDSRDNEWDTWYGTGDATRYFERDWWSYLTGDPDFAQAFYDRWAELRETLYSNEALRDRLREMRDEIDNTDHGLESAAARNFERWSERPPYGGSFRHEVAHIRAWLINRAAWMERRRMDGGLLPAPPLVELARDEGSANLIVEVASESSGTIYVTTDGSDPRAPGGAPAVEPYDEPLTVSGAATVTARVHDNGHWSTPTVENTASLLSLIGYWSFNEATLNPDFTIGGSELRLGGGPDTEFTYATGQDFAGANARLNRATGPHLRVNDPLRSEIILAMPTAGYDGIVVKYETRRSGQGAGIQRIDFTVDGETFEPFATIAVHDDSPVVETLDFSGKENVGDNPSFAVRISFEEGDGGDGGNNRFDNLTVEGLPLEGTVPPPVVEERMPLRKLVAGQAAMEIDPSPFFSHPTGGSLEFSASSTEENIVSVAVQDGDLHLAGIRRGGGEIIVNATDPNGVSVDQRFRVLVFPQAHSLAEKNFLFSHWSPFEPAGRYPENMLFLQSDRDDPTLNDPLRFSYAIPEGDAAEPIDAIHPYAAEFRTRINGLADRGISFINTGRGRDLGGALLALDTTGASGIEVSWLAGTVLPNERRYGLRLQYRIGSSGDWVDVHQNGQPLEYLRGNNAGDTRLFGPVLLPEAVEDEPYVQLLWRYHYLSGSGPRAELRLDRLAVASSGIAPEATTVAIEGWPDRLTENSLPRLTVFAVDEEGVPAGRHSGPVTLFLEGDGVLEGSLAGEFENGVAVFEGLSLGGAGSFRLRAEAEGLAPNHTETARKLRMEALVLPRFIQGEQDSEGDNLNRIPYVWRVRIDGLQPGGTYRYGNRVATDAEDWAPTDDGAGNFFVVPGHGGDFVRSTSRPRFLATDLNLRHAELTASEDGVWEGWLVTEPTGNRRFTPGNAVRMLLILNDGAGGEEPAWFLSTDSIVTVIGLGGGESRATGIHGRSVSAPRNMILLYDNPEGTGRPLAATVIERSGVAFDNRFAPFFLDQVAERPLRWGSLIPNELSTGVRRIEERHLGDGEIFIASSDPDGFPGTVLSEGGVQAVGPGVSFADWQAVHFPDSEDRDAPEIGGPEGDPSGRGRPNLLVYALEGGFFDGRDAVYVSPTGNGDLFVRFPDPASRPDLAYIVEASEDLVDWTETVFDSRNDPAQPHMDDAGVVTISYTGAPSESIRRFLRLRVREVSGDDL